MVATATGPRGRPIKGEERATAMVRLFESAAAKVMWLSRIKQQTAAKILDGLIDNRRLDELFDEIRLHAEAIKAAEDAARGANGLEPTPPLPA